MRDRLLDAANAIVVGLAQRLANNDWTVGVWEQAMRDTIKAIFGAEYVFGRGGLKAMQPTDWQRVANLVSDQYAFLEKFADEVAAGKLSQPQITIRAQMYVGSSVQAHETGKAAAFAVELPAQPGDGSSECLGNDRCTWFLRRRADGKVEATWVPEDLGPRLCATCRKRAKDWNPLVLTPGQPAPSAGVPRSSKLRQPSRVLLPVNV